MGVLVYCENCNYEYTVIAYVREDTKPGMLSKCPKCKKSSSIGIIQNLT